MATTTTRAQASKARPRRHANTLLRAAQILLAAVFAVAAAPKLPARRQETSVTGQETTQ